MEIIATHLGADFDAFASVLLARKLHPQARIFFPGSKEESVRRMLDGPLGEGLDVPEVRAKEVDPAKIERLILCDAVQRGRLGVVADWIDERPEIEVLAYDHHDPTDEDVPVTGGVIDPEAASTATLLIEVFEARGIDVSSAEATLLLLGLYEDTGSLTYAGTGPRDLRAAAWLVERGGDLAVVRRYAVQRLDPGRLDILHRMTDALSLRRVRGHRLGVLALELGGFVDELAPLVNRCLEIFELPLLFAVFGEGDRVTVIARGDAPGVHLGQLMEGFAGGGGHPTAASARIKGATPLETRERLLAYLETGLPPAVRAADLMVTGFHTLDAGVTVAEAKATLVERRINAAPVLGPDGRVVGVVTRQTLDGALQHGLGERRVETVADRDVEWVRPEAAVEEVGESFLRRHPRLILVGEADEAGEAGEGGRPRLVGLITRMQLLRHLHDRLRAAGSGVERRMAHLPEERAPVGGLLRDRLAPALRGQVDAIVAVSKRHRIPVYLVGGIVRDLLLGRENRDLDLVVEGDGPHFARLLAEELGGRVRVHEAFMTAVVVDPDERHVDVASARSEFYRAPAALPEVQMSPLRQDLYRRDFTINTLAIRLGPEPSPELVDYFGGRRDLENGLLRVLHSLSFIDDPTRVLRAVRLSLRLGFEISPETLHLVEVALAEGVFDHLSGSRLREELILLLDDPALAGPGLERLEALGVLRVIHPDLRLEAADRDRLRRAVAAWDWYSVERLSEPRVALWRLMLVALAQQEPGPKGGFGPRQVEEIADRLMLSGEDRELLVGSRRRLAAAREALARPDAKPHEVSEAMARLSGEEALILVGADDETVRAWARRELIELRPLTLTVRGRDLVERGVPPGPWMGEALDAVRRARLDGEIGADEEMETALDHLARRGRVARAPGIARALLFLLLLFGAAAARAQDPVRTPTLEPGSGKERSAAEILRSIPGDLRSTVVLRYDCASEIGRREVTLFANGTIRLWDGPPDDQKMALAELDPEALDAFLVRLDREDLSEEPGSYPGVEGDWVERCELDLPLREGRGRSRFEINRYTQLSLALSRLVRVAEEVGQIADERRGAGLDADYRPRRGDVLERPDGVRFRVVDFTSDGKGVELEGVDVPLTLYLAPDALPEVFARVVERRPDYGGPDSAPDGTP